jgi:hypothetical protein
MVDEGILLSDAKTFDELMKNALISKSAPIKPGSLTRVPIAPFRP